MCHVGELKGPSRFNRTRASWTSWSSDRNRVPFLQPYQEQFRCRLESSCTRNTAQHYFALTSALCTHPVISHLQQQLGKHAKRDILVWFEGGASIGYFATDSKCRRLANPLAKYPSGGRQQFAARTHSTQASSTPKLASTHRIYHLSSHLTFCHVSSSVSFYQCRYIPQQIDK